MKYAFRILGSGSSIPDQGQTQSCIWLEAEKLLLDCGEGCTAKLEQFDLLDKVEAIAISHFHPDHVIGLYSLLQTFHIRKRIKPLVVYLPESVLEFQSSLKMFYLDTAGFSFRCDFKVMEEMIDDFCVVPIPTNHMKKYSHSNNEKKSYAFSFPRSGFVYSSDVGNLDFLLQVDNISVLVLDGLHPDADEIILLGKDSKLVNENVTCMDSSTRIILTHGLSQKLKKIITSRFELANENQKYNF